MRHVPENLAISMKGIGFKERVLTYYENGKAKIYHNVFGWDFNTSFLTCVSRPTYSQAFDFFREKYGVEGVVERADDFAWYKFNINFYVEDSKKWKDGGYEIKTYEEAEYACLESLIEIFKLT